MSPHADRPEPTPITPLGPVLAWWRDCTCNGEWCGYEDADCPLCQLLDGALPCPQDNLYGINRPTQGAS